MGRERKAFFDYSRLKTIFPSSPLGGKRRRVSFGAWVLKGAAGREMGEKRELSCGEIGGGAPDLNFSLPPLPISQLYHLTLSSPWSAAEARFIREMERAEMDKWAAIKGKGLRNTRAGTDSPHVAPCKCNCIVEEGNRATAKCKRKTPQLQVTFELFSRLIRPAFLLKWPPISSASHCCKQTSFHTALVSISSQGLERKKALNVQNFTVP